MKLLFFLTLILSLKYASSMPTAGAEAHEDENDHSHLLETQISHSTTAKENDVANAHVKEHGHENVKRNSDDHHHEGYEKRSGTNGHIEHAIDKENDEHHQKRSTIDVHHNPEKRHSEHSMHHANHGSHTPSPENRKKRNSDQGISESNEDEPEEDTMDGEKEIVKRNIDSNHHHQEPHIVDEHASETSHHDLVERKKRVNKSGSSHRPRTLNKNKGNSKAGQTDASDEIISFQML